ncbi:actin cross-linking toxin VgrG1 [Kordia sp. SMS9]|uniref:type VI secretion system tip protein VgrG n=1 Tax=Kordia sp. SMS9 TaxID=2282170 RepID=UPI000E0D34E1|nr:type VI secretion system tip protein VgrG [Kordia sp. SMS9]AXG69260.1 actin cross-linking toxin VgrG1 [Kordia sp. SMS9]
MSASTNITSGGLVTFDIKTDGSAIPDAMDVQSIEVEKGINRISVAKIVIIDGSPATETFDVSSSSTFVPGNKITIEVGYDSKNETIFEGIITKQSIRIHGAEGSVLVVECRDEAVKMIVGRKSVTYAKKKDSDIMSAIIGNYSGLSADVSATTTEWPEQVQYYTTDWDFILARAETNGMIVTTLNGKVSVFPPDNDTTSVLEIAYGNNLLEFNASLDSVTQLGSAKGTSWDFSQQATASGDASSSYAGPGNLSSKKLSEVVGLSDYELQTTAPVQAADLTNWSKAALVKSAYAKIQGEVKFQGSNLVDPGKYITLAGLGDRFNGDHIISNVHHLIGHGNWTTEVSVGLSPVWFTEEPDVMAPPASGLLPGAQGLFNATVKKMYEDPDSQYRVLVDIPLFDPNGEGLWARLTNFYSTSGAGAFFMPEVGDEVVVGFLNEDPRYPIILGSMYSSDKNKPFEGLDPDEKNTIKAIVSKTGINVKFDDENKVLTLETPSKNTAIFSDQDKQITIKDQNNNSIVMSESGITITSDKDITVQASQNLTLKGDMGVSIESSGGDVQVKGMNIKQTADMQYSAEGSMTASLQGGTETTIKGAMVMIN